MIGATRHSAYTVHATRQTVSVSTRAELWQAWKRVGIVPEMGKSLFDLYLLLRGFQALNVFPESHLIIEFQRVLSKYRLTLQQRITVTRSLSEYDRAVNPCFLEEVAA